MAPIRRYLRITKFSVLEVRVYLHNPSDATWLLSSRTDGGKTVLERIIADVRPKVLPKLREENENARKKTGKKKKGIKDVVVSDKGDFEVSIFLKETSTRHSLLSKKKEFGEKPRIQSNASKTVGWLGGGDKENAIDVEDQAKAPEVLREEGDEDVVELRDIPTASKKDGKRKSTTDDSAEEEGEDEDDALFVSSSDDEFFAPQRAKSTQQPKKRRKRNQPAGDEDVDPVEEQKDDKKKLIMDTSFDGFSIYGRILCLIVTKKGKRDATTSTATAPAGGSQMMEQWIGTQAEREAGIVDDDEG